MCVRKVLLAAMLAVFALAAAPSRASADWLVTPFFGGNFGRDASFGDLNDFDDEFERKVNLGTSIGWMGAGVAGFELDFGWSPNFFQQTAGTADFEWGDSNVVTLMANVLVGAPIGGQSGPGVRPYGSGGIGLVRSNIAGGDFFNDLTTNDFGINLGGGVAGFFNDNVGLRGDLRYFRSLQDTEADGELDIALADFDFWRATLGVTFRFGNGN